MPFLVMYPFYWAGVAGQTTVMVDARKQEQERVTVAARP
jgi:hypothetical protein